MKKILKYIVVGSMFFSAASCSDYLDINTDPSIPQKSDAVNVLPPVLYQMARGESFDARFIGRYIQNFSVSNTLSGDQYERHGYLSGSDNMGEIWRSHYYSIGTNVDLMIDDATAKKNWDIVGAAIAIRAWSWQTMTDYHGEAILKQAWEPNRYVFDYDTQEDMYAHVVTLCNQALENLNKTDGTFRLKISDGVYKGDVNLWKKFVYGILARNANHLSNKSSLYKPDDVIKYCDLALQANTDNFGIPHIGTGSGDANFYGPLRNNLASFRPSTMITKLLDGTTFGSVKDPRLGVMIPLGRDTVYRGLPMFSADPIATAVVNSPKRILNIWGLEPGTATGSGRWIFADKAPHYIITAAEIQFIKAEAAFRKGDKALAFTALKQGITLHSAFCGVTAANITTYLTSVAVPQTADAVKMSDIMQQKYIAMFGLGIIETWVDMRRFKYDPAIYTTFTTPTTNLIWPDNNGKLAYRVRPRYNSEYVWNRASLDKFGGNNLDYHTYETWIIK
jgi:Starch-binding associating with outer membrane